MKNFTWMLLIVALTACDNTTEEKVEESTVKTEQKQTDAPIDKADLIKIVGDVYTEYYPDGKNIKFKGMLDENQERHDKWVYYSLEGKELSMTMYDHGNRHGHSIVKHPNGAIYYHGEYNHDKKTGVWKTYNEQGELTSEIDHTDTPNIGVDSK